MKKAAITMGDPNGISPEITIKALNYLDLPKDEILIIGNENILEFYKENYDLNFEKEYQLINIDYKKNYITPGKETKEAGEFSFLALQKACNLANNGEINAIITAPVSKNAMRMAGHNYSGQTEILEKYIAKQNQSSEMVFVSKNYIMALLTRHIALKDVPNFIKKDIIIKKVNNIVNSLKQQLKMQNIKIAICALNPHCGENGMFGDEELKEIIPAVRELKESGIDIEGPFPSDTLFSNCMNSSKYNCYIAMYHDQGLIPIKLFGINNCVNTTIGLDILRTSPAHGTAFDIAGKNAANYKSMVNAIELAIK